jgi:hypothetical protein
MLDAVAAVEPVTEEVTQTSVLITEQEVAFSTAAAVPVRPAKTRRGLTAVLRGTFVNSTANAQKPRRHYPPRRNSLLSTPRWRAKYTGCERLTDRFPDDSGSGGQLRQDRR